MVFYFGWTHLIIVCLLPLWAVGCRYIIKQDTTPAVKIVGCLFSPIVPIYYRLDPKFEHAVVLIPALGAVAFICLGLAGVQQNSPCKMQKTETEEPTPTCSFADGEVHRLLGKTRTYWFRKQELTKETYISDIK